MTLLMLVLACTPKPPPAPAAAVVETQQTAETVEVETFDVVLRDDDIVVVAVEEPTMRVLQFSDWQCPHCSHASPRVLKAVRERSDVELRFRSFPLSRGCTPLEMSQELPERCELARLAVCAAGAGRFEEFLAVGFNKEPFAYTLEEWSTPDMVACREAQTTQDVVLAHAQTGVDLGVMGTPSFYVERDGVWVQASGPDAVAELLNP